MANNQNLDRILQCVVCGQNQGGDQNQGWPRVPGHQWIREHIWHMALIALAVVVGTARLVGAKVHYDQLRGCAVGMKVNGDIFELDLAPLCSKAGLQSLHFWSIDKFHPVGLSFPDTTLALGDTQRTRG